MHLSSFTSTGCYLLFSSGNFLQVNAGGQIFIYYVNEVFKGSIFMLIDFPEYVWKIFMAKQAGSKTCLRSWNKCNPHTVVYMYWRVTSCIHLENALIYTAKLLLLLGGGQAPVNSHKHLLYIKVGLLREIMCRGMDYFCRKIPFV